MLDLHIALKWTQPFDTVSWIAGDYIIRRITIGDRIGYKAIKNHRVIYSFDPNLEDIKKICTEDFKRSLNTYPKAIPGYAKVLFKKGKNMISGIVEVMFPEDAITYQCGNKYQADKFIITDYVAAWCPPEKEEYLIYSRIMAYASARDKLYPNGQYKLGEVYENESFIDKLNTPKMNDSEIIVYPSVREVIENW